MSYRKLLVDNVTCSRRFHLTYDDETPELPRVEIQCPHCGVVVFEKEHHPEVRFAREENLTQTQSLSEELVTECDFEDTLTQRTLPEDARPKNPKLYR